MNDLSWSAALFWFALGTGVMLIILGTWKRSKRRNRRNRRIGLPAPECQRFPNWDTATSAFTRREAK